MFLHRQLALGNRKDTVLSFWIHPGKLLVFPDAETRGRESIQNELPESGDGGVGLEGLRAQRRLAY
jgi:hypothetical protein